MTDTHAVDCGIWNHHLRSAESAPNGCNCGASPSDTPSRVSPSAPAQIVHNHGTEDGPGIRCPERMVDGKLRGECLDSPRSPSSPVPSSETPLTEREIQLTILALMDALDANAVFMDADPAEYERAIKKLQSMKKFSLGQAWVSRVTAEDAPDVE